jgi:hypothetical protein
MSEITAEAVPNQFIVVLKQHTPDEVVQEHIQWAQAAHAEATALRAESDGPALTGVGERFEFPDWNGYVGNFDESLKAKIEAREEASIHPHRRAGLADRERDIYRSHLLSRTTS